MAELSLKNVLSKMGVKLESKESLYEAFKATEERRRLMKREWENKVGSLTKEIIAKLSSISSVDVPTQDPTGAPTLSPTGVPTVNPTDVPTSGPTKNPSQAPTGVPSSEPTNAPTQSPTVSPTTNPSLAPA